MPRKELIGIQYLRGIAAVFVVLDHTEGMCLLPKFFNRGVANGFFVSGSVGVELFFVISGFIISYVSLLEGSLNPNTTASSFLKKRFIRIIPFMWVNILVYAGLRIIGRGTYPDMDYLRAFTLFPVGDVLPRLIWTLRHEALFYLLFCLFVVRFPRTWLGLVAWALSPFVYFSLTDGHSTDFFSLLANFVFNRVNILFGLGLAFGIAYQKGFLRFNFRDRHTFLLCFLLSIPLFLFSYFAGQENTLLPSLRMIMAGLISVLLLLLAVSIVPVKPLGWLDKLGALIGDASYSIYLTHQLILSSILAVWVKYQPNADTRIVLVVIFLSCIAFGIGAHLWVEKPLITLTKRIIDRPKKIAQIA